MSEPTRPTSQSGSQPAHHGDSAPEQKLISPRKALVGVGLFLLVAILLAGFGVLHRKNADKVLADTTSESAAPTVIVALPAKGSPVESFVLPGNVTAYTDSPIYARTSGYLTRWYFDIGARVKMGALLCEISTPEVDQQLAQAQADVNTAEATANNARIQADRYSSLVQSNAVSRQDTDTYVNQATATAAAVRSAQANVKRLEELQSFEKVYAPFDGVITVRNTDTGWLINAGAGSPSAELFQLAQTSTLRIFVAVPEVYSRAARIGSTATLTLDEFPSQTFHGKVTRTSQSIDMASRTLNTEIDVDNHTGQLLPGAYVHVHLKLPTQSRSDIIPSNTLLFRSEGLRVGVVRNGHAQLIPITIGVDYGDTVQVTSGLTPADQVIVSPSDSLISGTPVRITRATAGTTPTPDTKQ